MNSFSQRATYVPINGKRERVYEEDEQDFHPPNKRMNTNIDVGEMTRIFNIIRSLEQRLIMCEITIQKQNTQIQEQNKKILELETKNKQQEEIINSNKSLSKLNKRRHENMEIQIGTVLEFVDQEKKSRCPDFTNEIMPRSGLISIAKALVSTAVTLISVAVT